MLEQQSFIEKATAIAEANGYEIEHDEDSVTIEIVIGASNDVKAINVAQMMKEIVNSVDTPEINKSDESFSTGEVKYFTRIKMRTVFYVFVSENGKLLALDGVSFNDKNDSCEEVSKNIQSRLDEANKNLEAQ